jgi:hypothetical protein
MKKVKKPKISIHKLFAVLMSAFAVNFLTVGIMQTYSWFFDSKTSSVSANVLNAEDIIEMVIVYDPSNNGKIKNHTVIPKQEIVPEIINPKEIIVTRKNQELSPNIYFDVRGSIANYTLQLHPVDFLDDSSGKPITGNTEIIKIVPICNASQDDRFIPPNNATSVGGSLSVRYLNGFISDNISIKFTDEVLLGQGRSLRDNQ